MKDLNKKIEDAESKKRKPGVLMSMRIPPLLVRGIIAHMEANDLPSVTAATIDLLSEGLVASAVKEDENGPE